VNLLTHFCSLFSPLGKLVDGLYILPSVISSFFLIFLLKPTYLRIYWTEFCDFSPNERYLHEVS